MINISNYYIPIVFAFCLAIGYCYKHLIPKDNKWLPTIMLVIGAIAGCIVLGPSFEAVVKGGITGLASTGFHQVFKQMLENPKAGAEGGSNGADGHEANDPDDVEVDEDGNR